MLYKRPLHRHESRAIEGTVGACVPFVSPDGQWIGFWSNKAIRRIPVDGGSPQTIVQLDEEPFGVDWGDDGHIVFGTREDGLRRVSVSGGPVETLTRIDEGREHTHRLPHVLPGGKALVFSVMPHLSGAESHLELLLRDTRTRTVLLDDAADARYVAPGRLVFVRQGTLMVVAFDLGRLAITGPEAAFSPGVMQSLNRTGGLHNTGAGLYSLSEEGTLAYVPGGRFPDLQLRYSWVDRRGHVEPWTSFGTKPVLAGRLSPDNSQLAFSTSGVANRIRLYDVRRDTETTVTTRGSAAFPVWNPGGTHVAFAWSLAGPANIWQASIAETDHMVRLTTSPHVQRASSWSPDGAHLLLVDSHPKDGPDILALHVATGRVTPLVASEYREQYPEVSPDGRWLAYVSDKSGRNEVYVRSFPDGAREEIVSTQGGDAPLWAPDGRELFYWNLDWNALMAVKLAPGSRPSPGRAVELLRFYNRLSAPVRNYDITNDGRRFLIRNWIYPVFKVTEIHLVQNWLRELTQRGLEKP
jgi:serine/threonine-protein kinase